MSSTPPAIEVHDLTVMYKEDPVLWGVDCRIERGSLTAVIGPNGAGKSTLVKAIMGLVQPVSGYINVFGAANKPSSAVIAYMPQRSEIDWDFPITAFDVALMGAYAKIPWYRRIDRATKEAARRALAEVGLAGLEDRPIRALSGGQQQRMFLARALVQDAPILLCDEPFAGIDVASERVIIELFKRLQAEGRTIVCVHHNLNAVREHFDHAILLNMHLVAAGATSAVVTEQNLVKAFQGRLEVLSDVAMRVTQQTFSSHQ